MRPNRGFLAGLKEALADIDRRFQRESRGYRFIGTHGWYGLEKGKRYQIWQRGSSGGNRIEVVIRPSLREKRVVYRSIHAFCEHWELIKN